MNRKTIAAATLAAAALALPAAATAHVTLQPAQAPAGGFARLDVRVPNEKDDEGTRKVEVQMPPGFLSASYEPTPGWTAKVAMRELDTPVEDHGEPVTEEVDTITFTASDGRAIEPGQFQDFGISVRIPERPAGTKLTFKSLQTYEGGEVVRWIGAPEADEPAPQVTVTAAEEEGGAEDASLQTAAAATGEDDGDGDGLAIAALIVGGLGLLAGGAALVTFRRTRAA